MAHGKSLVLREITGPRPVHYSTPGELDKMPYKLKPRGREKEIRPPRYHAEQSLAASRRTVTKRKTRKP